MFTVNSQPKHADERRRVLVCTPFTPRLDAKHGGKATSQLLLRIAERNDVALLALRAPGEDGIDAAIAAACAHAEEIPHDANGRLPRRLVWGARMLGGMPPWAVDCKSAEYAAALERLLREWQPEIVEIHLQVMAQYVAEVERLTDSRLPKVLVDYDPASAWAEDMVRTTSGVRRLARRVEVSAWSRYERATRPKFDAIVVFAELDLAAVQAGAGNAALVRVPLSVDLPAKPLDPVGTEPPTLLFFGGFAHHPNVDAALWLARTIFPRVRQRVPEARLDIVGHEPQEEVRALAGDGVSVHASVPDVTPFLDRAAVVVAPIRFGGSMRMKVLESFGAGKALVATSRAAEGVEAASGRHYLLADDGDEIVDALVGLLQDREKRREMARQARAWAEQNLGWEQGVQAFERLYGELLAAR
jgi:glycosyltransferase involved in cell wall biosynthesis